MDGLTISLDATRRSPVLIVSPISTPSVADHLPLLATRRKSNDQHAVLQPRSMRSPQSRAARPSSKSPRTSRVQVPGLCHFATLPRRAISGTRACVDAQPTDTTQAPRRRGREVGGAGMVDSGTGFASVVSLFVVVPSWPKSFRPKVSMEPAPSPGAATPVGPATAMAHALATSAIAKARRRFRLSVPPVIWQIYKRPCRVHACNRNAARRDRKAPSATACPSTPARSPPAETPAAFHSPRLLARVSVMRAASVSDSAGRSSLSGERSEALVVAAASERVCMRSPGPRGAFSFALRAARRERRQPAGHPSRSPTGQTRRVVARGSDRDVALETLCASETRPRPARTQCVDAASRARLRPPETGEGSRVSQPRRRAARASDRCSDHRNGRSRQVPA
jgi:hypothetical protein